MNTTSANINLETLRIFNDWEKLPIEERKRRVKIRMSNLGKYKDSVIIKDNNLYGSK